MDITVAVATYGSREWVDLACGRAIPSAVEQAPVVYVHGETLVDARNAALEQVTTEFVIYLDADDELEPGYVDAMAKGTADVRGPIARYIKAGGQRLWQPRVAGHTHDCTADCLPDGNWLLIGAAVRTEILQAVGGWRDFPWSEDWDVWLRCWKAAATFELLPDAVYRAHVRHDSRNRSASGQERDDAHWAIHRANFPELYEEATA